MQVFGDFEEAFFLHIDYLSNPQIKNYWYSVFVTPTADSITAMVGEIAKKLPGGVLKVYQMYAEDPTMELSSQRVVKAVFEVLQSRGIKYIQNTGAASIGQRINYPVETLRKREGICIETAALVASILERLGFETRLIITSNHAFVGWMTEQGGNTIGLLETTMIGDKNATFAEAYNRGRDEYNEQVALGNFQSGASAIVYVELARQVGIMPNNIP